MPWWIEGDYRGERRFAPDLSMHPEDWALFRRWLADAEASTPDEERGRGEDFGPWDGIPYPIPERPFRFWAELSRSRSNEAPPFLLRHGGGMLIPQSVIDLIERHEPGVHRYWPTEIEYQDGPLEGRFLLNICNRLDSIDVASSKVDDVGPFVVEEFKFNAKEEMR